MSHVTTKTILTHARANRYGVPCWLAGNMEMIVGQLKAAELCGSPVILAYNQGLSGKLPMDMIIPFMVRAAQRASVPVATILDHGTDIDVINKSMVLGLSSVMFDGSSLPYEENIRMTKEVVKLAKKYDAAVEAELGSVGGSAMELNAVSDIVSSHTDPALVMDFVARTEIDQLAVSVGNAHGAYRGKPRIDFELVRDIFKRTEIPLVLHGGSGLTDEDYKKIIECGISKINYYSVMGHTAVTSLRETIDKSCSHAVYHHVIDWGVDFFSDFSDYIYRLFGSAGQSAMIPGSEQKISPLMIVTEIAYEAYLEIERKSRGAVI
ncbi:MAG: class II fructose-bisphosphate aldolase [Christensenellales bacterium]|jgi:fructose-bisphosphate aldolase class II